MKVCYTVELRPGYHTARAGQEFDHQKDDGWGTPWSVDT
jgi:hypothetical protein